MKTLSKPLALLLALVAALTTLSAAPAAATVDAPRSCGNPHIEKYRYYYGKEITLWRCTSDHSWDYKYVATIDHSNAGDTLRIYYNPYGKGKVPGAEWRNTHWYDAYAEVGYYYGLIGELQPCLNAGDTGDDVQACAWS